VKALASPPPQAAPVQSRRRTGLHQRQHRKPKTMPPDVYVPDPLRVGAVKWLAAMLAFSVLFSILPALRFWRLETAPGWAQAALVIAALQLIYVAWMAGAPDWASVWVVMLVFAAVATLYAVTAAMAYATPLDKPIALDSWFPRFGMGQVRDSAPLWCGAVVSIMGLGTYLCGRTSARWRRAIELELSLSRR